MADGLLLVHAHPDDEAFATAGIIARAVAEGRQVDLVTCTGGEEGEIHDPTLDEAEARPRLREIRRAELECSLDALRADGPGSLTLHMLGYRDSGMMGTEANERPDAFWHADLGAATGRLVEIIRRVRPSVMVTYDPNGNYGHPDHINAHRIAAAAWEAAADPAAYADAGDGQLDAGDAWAVGRFYEIAFNRDRWFAMMTQMRERGLKLPWDMDEAFEQAAGQFTPPNAEAAGSGDEAAGGGEAAGSGEEPESFGVAEADITTIVDVGPYRARKRACMTCHRTQWQDMGWVLEMPEDLGDQALSPEHFILTRTHDGVVPTALHETWFW